MGWPRDVHQTFLRGIAMTILLGAGCRTWRQEHTTKAPFWELAPVQHPPTTAIPLILRSGHPRLVFKPLGSPGMGRTREEVQALYESDPTFRGIFSQALRVPLTNQHPAMLAACWMVTGDETYAEKAIEALLHRPLRRSGSSYYSDIWSHGLAYDWLFHHSAMTPERKATIETRIAERLATELDDLDKVGMALWHGRSQAANGAMIAALAIGDCPGQESALRRAAGHYVDCLRALYVSEGWPEGASYWIYNRAGPYALAADCVMTALDTDCLDGVPIREVMRRVGYWQLYQFAPNQVFEPYGDSAGSLRLGETGWWELTTDYFARLSRDSALMAGADYIRNRSPHPYGKRPSYWYVALSYDPTVRPSCGYYDPDQPELWMRRHLPQAMLFGRASIGVAFFRGAWGDAAETYATFKAGDLLAHHDHYDTGHFGIQKGGILAPRTGIYSQYVGTHRLGYTIQTVAANSLLVFAPGETSTYLRSKGYWCALSGGQRVIRPTSFTCANLQHFFAMRHAGPHLERADITAFSHAPDRWSYIAADITCAYNSTRWCEPGQKPKVSCVTRQFLYLRPEDAFVVYDRVETTQPEFVPRFLLHSLSKPQTATEQLVAGHGPEDGILFTTDRMLVSTNDQGLLEHHVVLPHKVRTYKIGGPHFRCYVECDGDVSDGFDGVNLAPEGKNRGGGAKPVGAWRTEVEPEERTLSTRFLNVLVVRLTPACGAPLRVACVPADPEADAVQVGETVVVFGRSPGPLTRVRLDLPTALNCLLLDANPGRWYQTPLRRVSADREGVLDVGRVGPGPVELVAMKE